MTRRVAGSAYLVQPEAGPGPGVLVLHSWWGLTSFFKGICDSLADRGFTALAPDLLGGDLPITPDDAQQALENADINRSAALVLSAARATRAASRDPSQPIGVIGFSMGASWALWLSARSPAEVGAAIAYYGTQSIDLSPARCPVLGHFATIDSMVPDGEVVALEAHLFELGRDARIWHYDHTTHWFAEADRAPAYDEAAATLAWQRTADFLDEFLILGPTLQLGDDD